MSGPEAGYLDISDRDQLKDALEQLVAPGADVVLRSCSTGEGGEEELNLANAVWEMVPHATVWAATQPTSGSVKLDQNGRFLDPGYTRGAAETYEVRPLDD